MKKTKPTWEDVPGILAQILEALTAGAKPEPVQETPEPKTQQSEPEQPAQTEEAEAAQEEAIDRKSIFNSILAINRANPGMRQKIRSIVSSFTPTCDGKFDDVPDAKLMDLKAQIEAANV